MEESSPPADSTHVGRLVITAKYHSDEARRDAAGEELARHLAESGDYKLLSVLCTQSEFSDKARTAFQNNLLRAAFVRCKAGGDNEPLHDLASLSGVPDEIAWYAGMALLDRYSKPVDEAGLWRLLITPDCHDDVRMTAGMALIGIYAEAADGPVFTKLLALATDEKVMIEVRAPAAHRLIDIAVCHGNYPILLSLGNSGSIPLEAQAALEGKADVAVMKALDDALASSDSTLVLEICRDPRLSDSLRLRIASRLGSTAWSPSETCSPGIGNETTGELGRRLAAAAGKAGNGAVPVAKLRR
jgi:hypothetical protein